MVTIRKYEEKDFLNVRFACLNAEGYENLDDDDTNTLVLNTFCDYYIEKEPENCFVIDDDGRAVGFIISAENFDKFKPVLHNEYLPKNKVLGEKRYNWSKQSTDLEERFKDDYPAHFHINILPEYQRMGLGGKLMNTLFEHYKKKGVKGVMLSTGADNSLAISFYKKYGFTLLEQNEFDVAFGMKLL